MREIIIIVLILIITIVGAIITQNYLNKSTDLVVGKLNNLKENMKKEDIVQENIKKEVEDVYNSWESVNEKWSTMILHDEIDLIEISLTKMKSKIESGDYDDSISELDTAIFLLNHIKEKEKLCLKNIF